MLTRQLRYRWRRGQTFSTTVRQPIAFLAHVFYVSQINVIIMEIQIISQQTSHFYQPLGQLELFKILPLDGPKDFVSNALVR